MTGTVSAQESAPLTEESAQPLSASDELDQTVRDILQKSVRTIKEAGSYSTNLRCQAKILGKTINGNGEFYQKRQSSSLKGQETVSARWEMTFYLPHSRFYQLMILNGEQDRFWSLSERRTDEQKDPDQNYGEIQVVNLASVRAVIERSPLKYTSIVPPWYSQPNVAQILEGILKSFQFVGGGETQFPGTNQPIYQIEGQLKPELTKEILESRGLNPAAGLSALPGEVPMRVQLLIDKAQGLPIQIRFYSEPSGEKKNEDPEETFNYTILFEQSLLEKGAAPASFFEISPGNETHDVTEQYLKDHHN